MKTLRLILCAALLMFAADISAKTEKVQIQGSVGKLAAVIQIPDGLQPGEKCPVVMLMHGFMGSKDGMLEQLTADRLAQNGIASIKFDFNGHGESEGDFSGMTVVNEIEDARLVYEYVASLPYAGPIAMTGHSQGGVVASMTAGELGSDKVSCVVLLAPAAVLRDDAIRGNTMGARYNPLDPPQFIELFGGKKLGGEYIRTAFNLPIYETAQKYTGPASIIHGTGDQVVPYTYGERYHSIWPDSELHVIPAADHMFSREMQKVVDLTVDFLVKNLKQDTAMNNVENATRAQKFLKEAGAYYLATVQKNGQPRVRPFGTAEIIEGKLYIQTGKVKNVYKQLATNPKAEVCALKDGEWIRISGELIPDERVEIKAEMLERNPSLKSMYKADDDNTIVLYFRNATATISSFTGDPVTFTF